MVSQLNKLEYQISYADYQARTYPHVTEEWEEAAIASRAERESILLKLGWHEEPDLKDNDSEIERLERKLENDN